jgi:hypothetical protein
MEGGCAVSASIGVEQRATALIVELVVPDRLRHVRARVALHRRGDREPGLGERIAGLVADHGLPAPLRLVHDLVPLQVEDDVPMRSANFSISSRS